MQRSRLVLRLILVLGWVGLPCGAAAESTPFALADTASAPLERAAFIALPAVYQVDVDVRVVAVITGTRRVPVNKVLRFRGTAFGVVPGRVVTARHVVLPRPQDLAHNPTAPASVQALDADQTRTRAITRRERITLTRARTEATAIEVPEREPKPLEASLVDDDESGDMALLDIDDREAPVLPMLDDVGDAKAVAVIGFGGASNAVPAARLATLDGLRETEETGDQRFGGITGIDVLPGDSGGPVIDRDGRVHGVVLRPATGRSTPVIGRIQTIRELLVGQTDAGTTNGSTAEFGVAMAAFWRRDYARAESLLAALSSVYTDPALVALEERRARRLTLAAFRVSGPSRFQGALLALGATAAFAALAFGALRLSARRR